MTAQWRQSHNQSVKVHKTQFTIKSTREIDRAVLNDVMLVESEPLVKINKKFTAKNVLKFKSI